MTKTVCPHCGFKCHGELILCKRCEHRFPLDEDLYRTASVVSYPKSGRTWFSHLYYHYTLAHFDSVDLDYGFAYRTELRKGFQRLLLDRARHRKYTIVHFSHGGGGGKKRADRLKDKTADFLEKQTILLTRDPRDVAVSHYHHLKRNGRMHSPDLSSFLRDSHSGVHRVVRFLNFWAVPIRSQHPNLEVIRYEDLQADTQGTLKQALGFLGTTCADEGLRHAANEASFESMQRRQGDKVQGEDPDRLRVRRGSRTGGTELNERDREYLDDVLVKHLDECFAGYRR